MVSRKALLSTATCIALVLSASACGGAPSSAKTLTFAAYGGVFGDSFEERIVRPFEKEFGVDVRTEPGASAVTHSKLNQQKSDPQIDVALMDGGVSELAEDDGLVAPIDVDRLSNGKNLLSTSIYKNTKNEVFGLSLGYYALGIVYNTTKVTTPPDSWKDIWSPAFSGSIAMIAPSNALGLPFLLTTAMINGGSENDITPGIEAMKKLDVASYYKSAGDMEALFSSGSASIGVGYATNAFALKESGAPIKYVVPKEGALATDMRMHLVKGSPNEELALKFMDYALGKSAQEGIASDLLVGPAAQNVDLEPELAAKMPWGPKGDASDLNIPPWRTINEKRSEWTDSFNREVLK